MAKVLIIDDDELFTGMLSQMVEKLGHESQCAYTYKAGLQAATTGEHDVVFLDVGLPDGSGLDLLPKFRETPSSPEVIIITGAGDADGAELAILNGAWDYIEKHSSAKHLSLHLIRALEYRKEKQTPRPSPVLMLEGIVGKSPYMRACYELVAQAAGSEANMLVHGETGTGKELFAMAIHRNSRRSYRRFVVVDCAALPGSLVESALFGHEKGAFTGADRAQEGLIKRADGGTLFLDEVGELNLDMQKAFLRVLEERRFRPVGSVSEMKSNFRLVSSTNRNLDQMVEQGLFRKDLLFRLRGISIELPPLRMRKEDIRELVIYYITKICENWGLGQKGFSPEFVEVLLSYDWPGNVRELIHALEGAIVEARHQPILYPKNLPKEIRVKLARAAVNNDDNSTNGTSEIPPACRLPNLRDFRQAAIDEAERHYLIDLAAIDGETLRQALARLSLPLKGRRKLTPETILEFLSHTGGGWFRLLDFEEQFQVNKKTAWTYLNQLLRQGLLEHNGEKANRVRYILAAPFRLPDTSLSEPLVPRPS
jgi:two-component system NtrC family response regulator